MHFVKPTVQARAYCHVRGRFEVFDLLSDAFRNLHVLERAMTIRFYAQQSRTALHRNERADGQLQQAVVYNARPKSTVGGKLSTLPFSF